MRYPELKWTLAVAAALAVASAACGGRPAAPPAARASQVYTAAAATAPPGLQVIDPGSGRVLRSLPPATPAPDWRSLYRVAAGALQVLDPLTGGLRATHPVPAWATDVHTSANGRWLVLSGSGDRFQVQDAGWTSAPVP